MCSEQIPAHTYGSGCRILIRMRVELHGTLLIHVSIALRVCGRTFFPESERIPTSPFCEIGGLEARTFSKCELAGMKSSARNRQLEPRTRELRSLTGESRSLKTDLARLGSAKSQVRHKHLGAGPVLIRSVVWDAPWPDGKLKSGLCFSRDDTVCYFTQQSRHQILCFRIHTARENWPVTSCALSNILPFLLFLSKFCLKSRFDTFFVTAAQPEICGNGHRTKIRSCAPFPDPFSLDSCAIAKKCTTSIVLKHMQVFTLMLCQHKSPSKRRNVTVIRRYVCPVFYSERKVLRATFFCLISMPLL